MPRVLLLDDDDSVRHSLAVMLERLGHDVSPARNVKEAITILPTKKFEILVTDLLMPEKDGFEMIRFIRRHAPSIVVIAMSGGGKIGPAMYLDMAEQLGVDATLVKPFSRADLENAIAAAMQGG